MKRYCLALMVLLHLIADPLFAGKKELGLAVASIFKDEAPYLKEWIDYHAAHGVDHFYLYNNNSQDDFRAVLDPYILTGVVELIEWPSVATENEWYHHCFEVQTSAFNDAIKRAANSQYRWLALIDTDEYIVCVKRKNIKSCLDKYYGKRAGVCINWVMYGTSNVAKAPAGHLLESLVMRAPLDYWLNRLGKSIVKPKYAEQCPNPHYCLYKKGSYHVNAADKKFDVQLGGIFIDKIRINHYWTKDEWYLENVKIPRYVRWGGNVEDIRKQASELNVEFDDIILR